MTMIPAPGSPEAVAKGCTCPIADNHHGRGPQGKGGPYWINENCPLHSLSAKQRAVFESLGTQRCAKCRSINVVPSKDSYGVYYCLDCNHKEE